MSAHRYWRLYNRLNNGDGSFSGLTEIQMRTTTGGANVCSGGTAISTGTIQAGSAAQCFDGDTTTTLIQWATTNSVSVGYDFGAGVTKDIVEIVVWPDKDSAARAFAEFDVQYSDDNSTWTTAWSCTYAGWSVGTGTTFTKPSVAAHRYWRIRTFESISGGSAGLALSEVEMKESVGGSDATGSGTASARTTFAGTSAANAFDNSSATIYSHNSAVAFSDWLQSDFGAGNNKSIVEVTILPRQDSSWVQAPRSVQIESGSDGISFIPRYRPLLMATSRTVKARHIDPASITTVAGKRRLWGIRSTTTQGGGLFGISELTMHATVGGATIISGGAGASVYPYTGAGTGNGVELVFDGSTASEYGANQQSDIVAYDFGIGSEVAAPQQIKITSRSGTNNAQAPTAFDFVYSDDGWNWSTQQSFTTPGTWAATETRSFAVTSAVSAGRRRQLVNG